MTLDEKLSELVKERAILEKEREILIVSRCRRKADSEKLKCLNAIEEAEKVVNESGNSFKASYAKGQIEHFKKVYQKTLKISNKDLEKARKEYWELVRNPPLPIDKIDYGQEDTITYFENLRPYQIEQRLVSIDGEAKRRISERREFPKNGKVFGKMYNFVRRVLKRGKSNSYLWEKSSL